MTDTGTGGHPASGAETPATQKLQALNQLIAGVAHEINNPLTSVQGLATLLLSDAPEGELRLDLEIVVSEVTRAVQIVRNLRAFAGRPDEPVQSCSLSRLVTQVIDARGYETRARGIALSLRLDEDLPPMLAVPTEVLQLVLMLLLRAERAVADLGPDGDVAPQIALTTSLGGPALVLTVEDNGPRTEDPSTDATLAACAAVAAQLGGSLREERGPDGGSTVTVELPADM
ncbi:MAG: sensor histidine kinase [Thermoleophilia bacterium]